MKHTWLPKSAVVGILAALVTGFAPQATLTQEEKAGLSYMRQEEKLAFDVYQALGEKWGGQPFGNISRAEQMHMNSVKVLLDRYGLPDPIKDLKPGEFADRDLRNIYEKLMAQGKTSRVEALKVGARIEEIDIYDLRQWSSKTKKPDLLQVFANLERGSRNHLRSFHRGITVSGGTYIPSSLTEKEYLAIANSPMERGRGF